MIYEEKALFFKLNNIKPIKKKFAWGDIEVKKIIILLSKNKIKFKITEKKAQAIIALLRSLKKKYKIPKKI